MVLIAEFTFYGIHMKCSKINLLYQAMERKVMKVGRGKGRERDRVRESDRTKDRDRERERNRWERDRGGETE